MRTMGRQEGITMWGIMMIILIGVFFLFLFFKLFPPYMQDAEISSQLSSVATSPGARNMAPSQVLQSIEKRFEIEDINDINVNTDIKIVPDGNSYAIDLNYTVELKMIGNVSVLLYFDHHVPVR